MTFGELRMASGWGLVIRELEAMIRRLELSYHHPHLLGKEEELEARINDKASTKFPIVQQLESFQTGEYTCIC